MNPRKQRSGCVAGAVCIMAALITASASAKTVYVSKAGNNTNDGLTWQTAKLTVQEGLNTAVADDQVWVAAGTYVENITLKLGVALYGGFAGNETELAQRDWTTNKSILDGNQAGSVVTSPAGATSTTRIDGFTIRNGKGTGSNPRQNAGGIYCSSSSPMIANNTISSNTTQGLGGGIFCSSSSAIIVNNLLTANTALSGGGIYCSSSSAMIVNNTIFANSGGGGGGISCVSSSPTIANTIVGFNSSGIYKTGSGTPTLRHNCVFGNSGYNYSGVTDPTGTEGNISVDPKLASVAYANAHIQPSSPCVGAGEDTIVQSGWRDMDGQARIIGPHVDIGADESDGTTWPEGPYVIVRVSPDGDDANDGSSWALAKQTVQAGINAAASLGGEIWVRAGTYCERITLHPSVHVYGGFDGTETTRSSRDWVANITVLDGQQGGSVVTILSGERISTIDGFTIRNGTGALLLGSSSCGGGICCVSSPTIENNVITSNAASIGGGIYCYNSSRPTIANTLIAGNSATYGGGISCKDSSCPTIANNTIMGNAASKGAGIECINSSPMIANTIIAFNASGIYRSGAGTPTLRYNCVYGNLAYDYSGVTDPTGTNGNISADPQLSCLPYGNGHIQPGSPCVDAGDDGVLQPGWTDMDGDARKAGAHVDIGADESDDTVWPVGPYTIVRVAPDGQDTNDGSSWALAKRTVQAGIDAAA
ncbi:MAG: hypothetical protein GX616_04275, partial [Planctomycetes bacterium]|nr:hypothetical protein [Planctomycetota bacterium]